MGHGRSPATRAVAYGGAGWLVEAGFRSLVASAGARRPLARPPTTPLMAPIYALALPLFEPVHGRIRGWPAWRRGAAYAGGIFGVEAVTGWLLRRAMGRCPWDYSGTRFHVAGLIRLDYAPFWALAGLAAERLHDALVRPG